MEQSCQDNKIAIVGGGPAGVYCALQLLAKVQENKIKNFSIDIIDKQQVLRTILPTGNGRCNITNSIYDVQDFVSYYPRGKKFLYSIFSRYFNYDALEFFNSIGIKTYTQDDGRIFPVSNSSKDVRDKMLTKLFSYKNVRLINKEISSKDDIKNYDFVVISAGSRKTESLIKSFGHNIKPFKKSLCALEIKDKIYPKGVSISSLDGDFIFTETGISGPLAFKISSINAYKTFPYDISISLFNYEDLIKEINLNPKKSIGNVVSNFVPRSFAKAYVQEFNKNCSEISKEKLLNLTKLKLTITKAHNGQEIVNAGGVSLDELDKNCKSKLAKNLWFCGEILDIDGLCGGFNLQNCWSTAYIVAEDITSMLC